MKHIAECESCWEAFMNLGVDEPGRDPEALAQKQQFFSKVTDPAYKGDHRMEQFQLLSSLQYTSYAKRVFLDYFTKLEAARPDLKRRWSETLAQLEDVLYARLQKKRRERPDPDAPIDAEVMMGVLDEIGEPEVFVEAVLSPPLQAERPIRRLYRSTEDRMIAGVCGGLGEYFRIDPTLLRILFAGLLFVAGSSILIYIALMIFLPVRPKPQPIFASRDRAAEAEAEDAPKARRSGGFFKKLIVGVLTFVLFVCLYFPLLGALGIGVLAASVGMFKQDAGFNIATSGMVFAPHHLSELGLPGLIAGGSLSLLFLSLFFLVLSFVINLHFKRAILSKSLQAVFVAFVVMSFFTALVSGGVIFNENRESASKVMTRNFPLDASHRKLLALAKGDVMALSSSDVAIRRVTIRSEEGRKDVTVKAELVARGETSERAHQSLKQLVAVWKDKGKSWFPTIQKRGGSFHFEHARIVILVPVSLSVQLKDLPFAMTLEGAFGDQVVVSAHRRKLRLHQIRTRQLRCKVYRGKLDASDITADEIHVKGQRSKLSLRRTRSQLLDLKLTRSRADLASVTAKQLAVNTYRGKVYGRHIKGRLQLENTRSKVRLKLLSLPAGDNVLVNTRGNTRLYFPYNNVPKIQLDRTRGRFKAKAIRDLPTSDARLSIKLRRGRVKLKTWSPNVTSDGNAASAPNKRIATPRKAAPKQRKAAPKQPKKVAPVPRRDIPKKPQPRDTKQPSLPRTPSKKPATQQPTPRLPKPQTTPSNPTMPQPPKAPTSLPSR